MENKQMSGGWTPFSPDISKEEREMFDKLTSYNLLLEYIPLLVSTQVVAGMNYRFICNVKYVNVNPEPPECTKMIQIFAPLPGKGEPHITHITDL
ncbi:hypothetical protein [Marinomonas spartinae]|uniref:hypothetical protein n=1 Tax=Marinomonas spartinae TaxID=1792290 RepID=UPI0018F27516|nr:hypothetical protein [Marinomonas spartinae]MBJ7555470.1 hypothetical protein [Marinomonas spartinae]